MCPASRYREWRHDSGHPADDTAGTGQARWMPQLVAARTTVQEDIT
jgi:hypothetical protein